MGNVTVTTRSQTKKLAPKAKDAYQAKKGNLTSRDKKQLVNAAQRMLNQHG